MLESFPRCLVMTLLPDILEKQNPFDWRVPTHTTRVGFPIWNWHSDVIICIVSDLIIALLFIPDHFFYLCARFVYETVIFGI